MKNKRYFFPILMGISMSIIMSLLNTGRIVFPGILLIMLLQAAVASIAALLFPAGLVGVKLTKKAFPNFSYLPLTLVSSLLPAIYFTLILSATGLLRMLGYSAEFFIIYLSSLPKNMVLGYIISIVLNLILDKILMK